ncbi:uncharacterized protein LOC128963543 [Oppia nitens]|uniref:uncharacterized protein LOC128963543 n=1 Tax=Oppia nitens TaxID=1686743 RepID=UPI0023DB8DD8|nr:uncharacterized protein LOC128963543 [Oppia nitens]
MSSIQSKDDIEIRLMEKKHMKEALNCFSVFDLQESLSTLEAFYECDSKAFYVAINRKDNRVIGACGAPVTTHNSGFLGLYVVDSEFQNRGIGKQLFESCLQNIGNRNCGLHAVPEKLEMYRNKAGFRVSEGISMVVCSGIPMNWQSLRQNVDKEIKIEVFNRDNNELLQKIIDYDSRVQMNGNREKLINLCLHNSGYTTFVAINDNTKQLNGFGCIRIDYEGKGMIGPVYGDNEIIGEVLIYNLLKSCPVTQTKGLLYMTISSSMTGIEISKKLELTETERCERVFTKHVIPVNHSLIYCLFSPNFGL